MSSAMPLFALNLRRYFGTLLVSNSSYSQNNRYIDGVFVTTSKQISHTNESSAFNNKISFKNQLNFNRYKSSLTHRQSSIPCQNITPNVCRQDFRSVARNYHIQTNVNPDFGILFDIDGVIVRGKNILPSAPHAFQRLVDDSGKFRVPTVFVTNAGNTLRKKKADQLSTWLGVQIEEDQVVMSHSPLKMFRDYQNKHVLVIGQGPVDTIARSLGFSKVTTITQLRHAFPTLDAVDHKRRRAAPCAFEKYFPRIEAILLFGEPIRWETSLQLIVDVLVTDGLPCINPQSIPQPHLPILACNMDLQWMAEAPMPRFGHGAFLLCLEQLYKKVTGSDLVYKGLIGKPSEITYRHGEHVLQCEAMKMGIGNRVKNIYCIGDNICTDIFGANLYNRYLQQMKSRQKRRSIFQHELETEYDYEENRRRFEANVGATSFKSSGHANETKEDFVKHSNEDLIQSRSIDHLLCGANGICETQLSGAENCFSILVETGVYSRGSKELVSLDHSPRDFLPVQESYQEPTYTVNNVLDAVNLIFQKQKFH